MRLFFLWIHTFFSKFFLILKALFVSGWCLEACSFFSVDKRRLRSRYSIFCICFFSCCGIFILLLVLGFVPENLGVEVRKPLENRTISVQKQNVTRPLSGNNAYVRKQFLHDKALSDIGISSSISRKNIAQFYGKNFMLQASNIVISSDYNVDETVEELLTTSKVAFIPLESLGEPLSFQGLPLRWKQQQRLSGLNLQAIVHGNQYINRWIKVNDTAKSLFKRAEKYRSIIEKYARRYNLSTELVYAIICVESSFHPEQVSNRYAHGLMQVVPKSAGFEVNKWFGVIGLPTSDDLLHPETNIKYGTSYLYLLMNRHLHAIKNDVSREYCAIAAYNMGINAMLRVFGETTQDAFAMINKYNSEQVQDHLMKHLPSRETRMFLKKVLSFKESFTVLL